jgi:hypothetical protein
VARWTVGDAIEALESRDKDAREDIGRTCPLFVTATYSELLRAVDMMTARQVEARLRQILDDAEVEEPEPVKKKKKKVVKPEPRKTRIEEDDDMFDDDEPEENAKPYLEEDEEEDLLDDIFDDE